MKTYRVPHAINNKGTKKERECLIEPIGESHRSIHEISLVELN